MTEKDESLRCERERIGSLMASVRQSRKLTVRQLSEKTGVSASNICNMEKGKYSVGLDILIKLCRALEVQLDILNCKV